MKARLLEHFGLLLKGEIIEVERLDEYFSRIISCSVNNSNGALIKNKYIEFIKENELINNGVVQYTSPEQRTMIVPAGVKKVIFIFEE